jgi:polyhydroxyalkanoate synthesis regulator phasin
MKKYLVIFDSMAHDLVGDGSDYFLKKGIIEADTPKGAVKALIDKMVKEEFEDGEVDKDDVKDFIDDIKSEGMSVVELASPKVTRID